MILKLKKQIKKIPFVFSKLKKFQNLFLTKKYLRIQKKYKALLLSKIFKVKSQSITKVAFFVTQKQLWNLQSVYDAFDREEFFEVFIVVFPNEENKIDTLDFTLEENYVFFKEKAMNVIYGYDQKLKKYLNKEQIDADIIFYDQPYPGIDKKLSFENTCKSSLICYVPYGYKVAKAYEEHFNMPLHNICWKVFAESDWHKNQFIKLGKTKGKNVVTSGYPKFDIYGEPVSLKNDIWKSNDSKFKKIIWAPHWSITHTNYSTFDKNYKFFQKMAIENSNISWIFKPHQRLRYFLEEIQFMSKKDIDEYYDFWNSLPNTKFYNEGDYFDIFKTSDALITDCGSFLAEYLPSKKPIMLLVNKNSIGYNEIGEKIVDSYYKAYKNDDIINFIENVVIKENDYLKKERLLNLNLIQPNGDGAGKFIVNHIKNELAPQS